MWEDDTIKLTAAAIGGIGKGGIGGEMMESQVEDGNSVKFQLGIMRNVEHEIAKRKRKATPNWVLVQEYMLGNTSKGGSTSCCIHCRWMGVDPDGYTFW